MGTKVKDIMHRHPDMVKSTDTIKKAAQHMKKKGCGVLPVGTSEHVEGIITDRDITLRVIASGKDPAETQVKSVMTKKVYFCEEDADITEAAQLMIKHEVGRLIVRKGKKVTGIVTQAELLSCCKDQKILDGFAAARKKRSSSCCCN